MILAVEFLVMPRLLLHSVLMLLAIGALTGCQIHRPYGFRQFRFDVNTTGRPAFVFDRFRTDNYRSQLPPDVRPTVELTRLPASVIVEGPASPPGSILPVPDNGLPSSAVESGLLPQSRSTQAHLIPAAFLSPASPAITTSCEWWPATSSGTCCPTGSLSGEALAIGVCSQTSGLLCPACAAALAHGTARY